MSDETGVKPISMAAVTALALSAAGAVGTWMLIPGLKFFGIALAIAAVIVGAAAAVNARRRRQPGVWLAWAAVGLGVVTIVGMLIWQATV